MHSVKVSAKMARLRFNGCDPIYIRDVCHASCCESSTHKGGALIQIHVSERAAIEARGGIVNGTSLQHTSKGRCPFKTSSELCGLHFTPDKPFGCIASPFTLNKHDTLIVRHRYISLKCYNDGRKLPAYVAFRTSLDRIFGAEEALRIVTHLDDGGGDMIAKMGDHEYAMLTEADAARAAQLGRTSVYGVTRELTRFE